MSMDSGSLSPDHWRCWGLGLHWSLPSSVSGTDQLLTTALWGLVAWVQSMIPEHTTQGDRRQTLLKKCLWQLDQVDRIHVYGAGFGQLKPWPKALLGHCLHWSFPNSSSGTDQHLATALWGLVARVYSNQNLLYRVTAAKPCRKSAQGGWIKPTKCIYMV